MGMKESTCPNCNLPLLVFEPEAGQGQEEELEALAQVSYHEEVAVAQARADAVICTFAGAVSGCIVTLAVVFLLGFGC
jgi:hypothetical protein